MQTQAIQMPQILDILQKLSVEKLMVVYDFISYLAERDTKKDRPKQSSLVLIQAEEYEQLLRYKRLAAFHKFTRELGQEVEKSGLSEEELMAELEETKRQVFEEEYGSIR